jgi:GntR family transcriptional regulator
LTSPAVAEGGDQPPRPAAGAPVAAEPDGSATTAAPVLGRPDSSSLRDRVFEVLVDAIQKGSFENGRLPSEPELAAQLGVSRTTVRSALTWLEQVGVVNRRPGSGTRLRPHVSADVLALHGLVPFATLLAAGHTVTATAELRRSPGWSDALAERLGRAPEGPCHEITRVLYADGEAAMMLRERIPADVLAREPAPDDLDESILRLSRRLFVTEIDHAIATLIPKVAGRRVAALFGIGRGAPHLFIEETFYSADDHPLGLSDVTANPAFLRLSVYRRVSG